MIVARYGVHWAPGGIGFLLQGNGAQHALPIEDLECPFQVRLEKKLVCPHAIDLSVTAPPPPQIHDPLFRVMLPLPVSPAGPRAWIMDQGEGSSLVEILKALSSPRVELEEPVWWRLPRDISASFKLTNLAPMIFTVPGPTHLERMGKIMELARLEGRRVLFLTEKYVPAPYGIERLETRLSEDVAALPLQAIGAGVLRNYLLTKEVLI